MSAGITNDDVNDDIVSFSCDVADNATVGAIVDMKAKRLHRIFLPAGFVTCDITFEVGHSANTAAFKTAAGVDVKLTGAAAGTSILVDLPSFFGVQFVKPKFSVAQTGGARVLQFIGVPR